MNGRAGRAYKEVLARVKNNFYENWSKLLCAVCFFNEITINIGERWATVRGTGMGYSNG